ncbi:MAG: PD-(D/E)XK nuclease family protein [Gemmatimonadota bacterium]|nr:PD-(D/E)XK nuclease family protein [Gemmatimonadota bacterium]
MNLFAAPDLGTLRTILPDILKRLRGEDPLARVRLVTPGDLVRAEVRRDLTARTGGFLGIEVTTWAAWVDSIALPEILGEGGRRLDEAGFERVVARACADLAASGTSPDGPLERAADTPGLARLAAAALRDLMEARLDPDALAGTLTDRVGRGLLGLYREVLSRLDRDGFHDTHSREATAARILRARPDGDREALLLFGFHNLTPLQHAVLDAASVSRSVTLLVPGPGAPGGAAAQRLIDAGTAKADPVYLDPIPPSPPLTYHESVFEIPVVTDPGPECLELLTCPVEDAEVRAVARRIRREVETHGHSFDHFLIVVPPAGPSPALFHSLFSRAGIPLHDRAGIPASATPPGRAAIALARMAASGPGEAARAAVDFPDEVARIQEPLRSLASARNWPDANEAFRNLYRARHHCDPAPFVENCLLTIEMVHGDAKASPVDFLRELRATLHSTLYRPTPDDPDTAAVLLVRADAARAVTRPFVFYTGLVEKAIRPPRPGDPLLPESTRERVNHVFESKGRTLARREDVLVEDLLLARFALEAASGRAVFSWSARATEGGQVRNPSGILLDIVSARAGVGISREDPAFSLHAPAEDRALRERYPTDPTDLALTLFRTPDTQPGASELARILRDGNAPYLANALRAANERWRGGTLTAHDAVLADGPVLDAIRHRFLGARTRWSPTSLERLLDCPFAFLVRDVLKLRPPEPDDDDPDARSRGQLFHAMAADLYRALAEKKQLPLTPERLRAAHQEADRIAREHRREFVKGASGSRHLLHDIAAGEVAATLAESVVRECLSRDRPAPVPTHFELSFGTDIPRRDADPMSTEDAATLRLTGAKDLRLKGRVDRIDRAKNGVLRIVDYKTGEARTKPEGLRTKVRGRSRVGLQLPLYMDAVGDLLGARVERAEYRHRPANGKFADRGLDGEEVERLRPELTRCLGHALDCVRRGWFASVPGDTCCSQDLAPACGPSPGARARRKATDPALAEHHAIVRGEEPVSK